MIVNPMMSTSTIKKIEKSGERFKAFPLSFRYFTRSRLNSQDFEFLNRRRQEETVDVLTKEFRGRSEYRGERDSRATTAEGNPAGKFGTTTRRFVFFLQRS